MAKTNDFSIALVMSGGNALGAYQAGVYQALHEAGREPDRVVGTSAGAINGALIAGNAPDRRLLALTAFWEPTTTGGVTADWPSAAETARRSAAVLGTVVVGRPGVFGPIGPFGSWWDMDAAAAGPALFDTKPLARTLARLVDWDRLNAGSPRFVAGAVDLETGDDVVFDTARDRIGPDHIRASAALLPTFPPVEIDGRAYVDGGLSANLPLDPVLAAPGETPIVCIAVDLLPLVERRPQTLGEAVARAQDLVFAAQSRRTIARWQATYAGRDAPRGSVTLARLAYRDQAPEVAGKAMDFSPESVRHRWDAGLADGRALLTRLAAEITPGAPGLTIV